jgi:hypothetical protein
MWEKKMFSISGPNDAMFINRSIRKMMPQVPSVDAAIQFGGSPLKSFFTEAPP